MIKINNIALERDFHPEDGHEMIRFSKLDEKSQIATNFKCISMNEPQKIRDYLVKLIEDGDIDGISGELLINIMDTCFVAGSQDVINVKDDKHNKNNKHTLITLDNGFRLICKWKYTTMILELETLRKAGAFERFPFIEIPIIKSFRKNDIEKLLINVNSIVTIEHFEK